MLLVGLHSPQGLVDAGDQQGLLECLAKVTQWMATSHKQSYPVAFSMKEDYCTSLRDAIRDAGDHSAAKEAMRTASAYARFTWSYGTEMVQGIGAAAGSAAGHLATHGEYVAELASSARPNIGAASDAVSDGVGRMLFRVASAMRPL